MAMSHFRIFTGAPTRKELEDGAVGISYRWQTVSSQTSSRLSGPFHTLPPATLASADRRISMLYENIIFHPESDEEAAIGGSSDNFVELDSLEAGTMHLHFLQIVPKYSYMIDRSIYGNFVVSERRRICARTAPQLKNNSLVSSHFNERTAYWYPFPI